MCIKIFKNPSVLHENVTIIVMENDNNHLSRDTDQVINAKLWDRRGYLPLYYLRFI